MINFVMGTAGTGKSTYIYNCIADDLKSGKRVILLTPEQYAVESEQAVADITENINTLGLEVLSFKRLSNRIFRTFGGLSYNNINRGARLIIMWQVLCELSPVLSEYKNISLSDRNLINLMLDTIKELKQSRISAEKLGETADELALDEMHNNRLVSKLNDISMIFSAYETVLHTSFDDPSDDITLASEKLAQAKKEDGVNFFAGYNVYVDGFNGFTAEEYDLLRQIIIMAENVTFTLCLDVPFRRNETSETKLTSGVKALFPENMIFNGIRKTERKIRRIVSDELGSEIKINSHMLSSAMRYKSEELVYLHDCLWNFGYMGEPYQMKPEHINIVECRNAFCEAEYVAKAILREVRGDIRGKDLNKSGRRYKDIAVIAHDAESYRGIIDAVFEKYKIPYFMSERSDLVSKPLFRLILSAFAVYNGNFSRFDVIAYMKTGLLPVTRHECDIFETYTKTWDINGKRFTDEYDWNMNPDGYTDIMSDRGYAILSEVNSVRRRICEPLSAFFECFGKNSTIRSVSSALYEFVRGLGVYEKMISRAASNSEKDGDTEDRQLWNLFKETLDQLVAASSDLHVEADTYIQMFSSVLGETDMGTIPSVYDKVIIGSAANLRVPDIESVYVIGLNYDVFPSSGTKKRVFSDRDFELLSEAGLEIGISPEDAETNELFEFYRAVTGAACDVTLLYPSTDFTGKDLRPSVAIKHIRSLFPLLKTSAFSMEKFYSKDAEQKDDSNAFLIENKAASFEYVSYLKNTAVGKALYEIYSDDPDYKMRIASLDIPLNISTERLSAETTKKLFGGNISLTQSRLESFVLCRFSFFCKYYLKLRENRRAAFNGADMGNFIHRILERFVSEAINDGTLDTEMNEKKISDMLDQIINDYIYAVCGSSGFMSSRLTQLFRRLRRTSGLLIRNLFTEFRQSKFVPRFFEMPIEFGNPNAVTPFSVPLPDGNEAYIYGKIDRVDSYVKNGKVYIRVVDYKTGTKDFSIQDISLGMNLQMLLYLFSLWQNKNLQITERLGGKDGDEIIPAGVVYFSAKSPEISLNKAEDNTETLEKASDKLTRKGLFLFDRDVLSAMDSSLSGKYVPVKFDKAGEIASSSSLATLEQFGGYMNQVENIIAKIGCEIKNGSADACPMNSKKYNACEYCHLKPVCRN